MFANTPNLALFERKQAPGEPPYFESAKLDSFLPFLSNEIHYNFSEEARVLEVNGKKYKLSRKLSIVIKNMYESKDRFGGWISDSNVADELDPQGLVNDIDIDSYFKRGTGKELKEKYIERSKGRFRLKKTFMTLPL